MKYAGIALLTGIAGYIVIAAMSYFLISKFSSNGHDRSVEASMTSLFVYGPLGLILALIGGYIWAKQSF